MEVKKAKREKIKVPIMITGASGSGKTVSALIMAKGIIEKMFPDLPEHEQWEKIGVIDTEHKRSLLYANTLIGKTEIGEFMHVDFEAPFTVDRYVEAFNLLKGHGVEVILVDSMTHAWSAEGGILEQVEKFQRGNPKMQMQAWNKVKPTEKAFLRLLTGNSVYVIGTTRSKQAYDMSKDENGKTQIVKMGLKPDQKDSLEYEFAIAFRIDEHHFAEATKDNSNLFSAGFQITKETGHQIYEWSSEGIDLEKVRDELISEITQLAGSSDQHEKLFAELHGKIQNQPLKNIKTKWLESMKARLEKIEVKQVEEKQLETQQELFDSRKPPMDTVAEELPEMLEKDSE